MEDRKQYDIVMLKEGEEKKVKDIVIVEYSLKLFLNGKEFVTLLCTPKSLKSLVVGFLYSEGIIKAKNDIKNIKIDKEKGNAYVDISNKDAFSYVGEYLLAKKTITTACAKVKTVLYNEIEFGDEEESPIFIDPQKILLLSNELSKKSELFMKTGGVHSCALCNQEKIILFEDDIGRHNALDKVLGKALLEEIKLEDKVVFTTGRISSEILMKVAKRKISTLVSRAAPTNVAIDMARKLNITLIGFARGQRMNIYTQ